MQRATRNCQVGVTLPKLAKLAPPPAELPDPVQPETTLTEFTFSAMSEALAST